MEFLYTVWIDMCVSYSVTKCDECAILGILVVFRHFGHFQVFWLFSDIQVLWKSIQSMDPQQWPQSTCILNSVEVSFTSNYKVCVWTCHFCLHQLPCMTRVEHIVDTISIHSDTSRGCNKIYKYCQYWPLSS